VVPKQPLGYNQYDAELHREGLWIISYPNGLPRQWDTYADDRLNGPSLEWSPSGQLLAVRYYKDGLLDSAELLLDHSGQWVQHAHYRAGQWHGIVTTFYGNGKPKEQRTYEHGVLSGISTWFYDNGNPMAQYPYVAGKKQGRAQYFYDNGVLEKNEWFEENLSVRWETFDLDGKQTGSGKTKKNP
jgi:antitoxin component YwqK of YwqJK toxin-antitoxin module